MKTLVIYHNADLDGICSAAIVNYHLEDLPGSVVYHGANYGDPIPWDKITEAEQVFIVDFSYPMVDMIKILRAAVHLVWLDHHKSAIDEAAKCGFAPAGYRQRQGKAACELVWEYLSKGTGVPVAIQLLGRYDIWDFNDEPLALPFQYGMRGRVAGPCDILWGKLYINDSLVPDIVDEGKAILAYQAKVDARLMETSAFEANFDGLPAIAYCGPCSSQTFESLYDPQKHKLMVGFRFVKDRWMFSYYSTHEDVDCAELCKAHGGGGHKGAAGYMMEHDIFAGTFEFVRV
jgi:oligoribonuclease NrnB/cAMP/cGMP phosphodiesterase (DHH superfamily)